MGFKKRILLLCVLSLGPACWAQPREIWRVTVFVNDSVGVSPRVLRHAETEAARLFLFAGIAIRWMSCAETDACRRPPHSDEFVLHIVAKGTTRSDFIFGEAFLGPDGRGKYADVFFNRVRQFENQTETGQLLGSVAAHEVGHLLLGSHAHSLIGIMEPVWQQESLRRISMGTLTFTPEQQERMKSRLRNEALALTSVTAAGQGFSDER